MKIVRTWSMMTTLGCIALVSAGCGSRQSSTGGGGSGGGDKEVIRVEGSDTMVNLAQAWAEEYNKTHPEVSIQVSGGGSGVGIASLIDGMSNMANASRKMKDNELARAEENTGKRPQETVVAMDALAVYVHKANPIESISIEELAEIYGDEGAITTWGQLGVQNVSCQTDEITRVSRQNNSGTYHYFREAVLGEGRDFKLGSIDQSGSKDVVALVSRTPCAIGYSGMGYHNDEVKWLKILEKKGELGVEPSVASASDGSYPIARPLQIYTLGEPEGALREYIDWILGPEGQQIVLDLGYVPVATVTAASDEPVADEPVADEPVADEPVADEPVETSEQE